MPLEKVLIVEDEIPVAAVVYETFKDDWKHVDHATNVRGAMLQIEASGNHYDFIFLDAHLEYGEEWTVENGLRTITEIRKASSSPIVLHTADEALIDVVEPDIPKYGVYGVIRKGTLEKHQMEDVIEKALLKWSMETYIGIYREEKARYRHERLAQK